MNHTGLVGGVNQEPPWSPVPTVIPFTQKFTLHQEEPSTQHVPALLRGPRHRAAEMGHGADGCALMGSATLTLSDTQGRSLPNGTRGSVNYDLSEVTHGEVTVAPKV